MLPFAAALGMGALAGTGLGLYRAAKAAGMLKGGGLGAAARLGGRGARAGLGAGARLGGRGLSAPALRGRVPLQGPLMPGASRGSIKAHPGLLGGAAKFGALMGGASILDTVNEIMGSDMSPMGRAALSIGAFGMRFGGYRNLLRGAAGSGFAGASAMTGRDFSRQGAFVTNRILGGMFTRGSMLQSATLGALKGVGGFAAKFPARTATGLVQAPVALGRAAGSMFGGSTRSISHALDGPVLFSNFWKGGPRRAQFAKWLYNKDLDAPIGHGMFAMFGAAAGASALLAGRAAMEDPYRGVHIREGDKGPIDHAAFGQGVASMPRGGRPNMYGPSLTLQLHHNNTRTMPH